MWKSNVLRLELSDTIVAETGEQKMYGLLDSFLLKTQNAHNTVHTGETCI